MQSEGHSTVIGARLARSRSLRARFVREVAAAGLPTGPAAGELVTARQLAGLPLAAQRYLRFMKVGDRPRTWSFRLHATGAFRRSPREGWMPCEAWQYDTRLEIARIFQMRLRLKGLLPMLVRDTYVRGQGQMVGRVFDTFRVVDESNEMMHVGELVTYLNDAILFAPSMLLGPEVTWSPVSTASFDVALSDHGRTVTGRVFLDECGRLTDFSTLDRYASDPESAGRMVQTRWSTPIRGWTTAGDRPVPASGSAIWHFPKGDFEYVDLAFDRDAIAFDVPPGA